MENEHGVVPHHFEGSASHQHLMVPIVEHSFLSSMWMSKTF